MKNGGLENNKRRGNGLFDLDFNCIRLVLRDGRHRQQVGGANKEISMERSHTETWVMSEMNTNEPIQLSTNLEKRGRA